jgi:hypothetical protein
MSFWSVSVVLRCLNVATLSNDSLPILIFWFCPGFWWRDIIIHFVFSAFISRPRTLLASKRDEVVHYNSYHKLSNNMQLLWRSLFLLRPCFMSIGVNVVRCAKFIVDIDWKNIYRFVMNILAFCPVGTRGSFPGGKAAGAWSWPLTSSAMSKNEWSYTSTPQYVFMALCSAKAQGQLYLYLDMQLTANS